MNAALVWTAGLGLIAFGMGRRPWRGPRARQIWFTVATVALVVLVVELVALAVA